MNKFLTVMALTLLTASTGCQTLQGWFGGGCGAVTTAPVCDECGDGGVIDGGVISGPIAAPSMPFGGPITGYQYNYGYGGPEVLAPGSIVTPGVRGSEILSPPLSPLPGPTDDNMTSVRVR